MVFSLSLGLTGCSTNTVKEPVRAEKLNSRTNSSIVEVNECSFSVKDSLLGEFKDSCQVYLDKLTNTYYVKFHGTYRGTLFKLVNSDGTSKLYSKDNKNELVLVEQGEFLVFEDKDTGVQYVVANDYTGYVVRGVVKG